ncbi:MAG: 3-methyl-2-oxobutanoate hydroxymethyltransferase [uncultured Frankineae bacterium]|uniref:3-methyl-2-oxobutanoate hydroxymethyltransferase n=1 Tax=uncultured Frankineae bacterium TaxID=437475 RepID=A0A6J4LMU0_9ACTN|nr:MAG: 3-methyl-2-oxobutanoate hydroxymethyltransferase [uncultured Frankineae bacterium]
MSDIPTLYGGVTNRRVRPSDLQRAKDRGERWAMLTSYDMLTAGIFEQAGIPVLLVGDSAGNNVLGHATTVPVTVEELLPLVRAVVRSTTRPMVVADLPFGSYQASPEQALATAARFLQSGGAHAVKLEGGRRVTAQVELLVSAGVPVMGHVGLTPQSELVMGLKVQGRGQDAAHSLIEDALALQDAGAFAVVLEAVPADLAERVTKELVVPTIGIGAGVGCDAQVLVWTDMAGLTPGAPLTFVKRYADLRGVLAEATREYAEDVREGRFPGPEHSFR